MEGVEAHGALGQHGDEARRGLVVGTQQRVGGEAQALMGGIDGAERRSQDLAPALYGRNEHRK